MLAEKISAKLNAGTFNPYPVDSLNYQPESVQGAMQAMSIETAKQLFPPLEVDTQLCNQCGECENLCPARAITCSPYPQIGDHCFLCFNCVRLCEKAAFKIDLSQSEDMLRGMAEEYAEQPLSEIFV